MKSKLLLPIIAFTTLLLYGWKAHEIHWMTEKHSGYTLSYTLSDKKNKKEYQKQIDRGIVSAKQFFQSGFTKEFNVYIHPNRKSLDSIWQKDWNMPDFQSECWMVASGIATKLDMISPKTWDKEACEHHYSHKHKTQQLITHELIHVYHGQWNQSPDFSNVENIDWFVEGLATYASGQCDAERITAVKKAIGDHKVPNTLDKFWTGKIKYGLSGSVVQFIDHKYGRKKLIALLPFNKKTEILTSLNVTEATLLEEWKAYMQQL